ncbi:MAG TPA: hypothetical protein PK059_02085 [Cyclobacteriaceae bacterium]|nr:hypothetical protein [Cyclobacteriaceae bacterium]
MSNKALTARIGADLTDLRAKMDEAKGLIGGYVNKVSELGPIIAGAFSVGAIVAFGKAAVNAAGEAIDGENRLLVALKGRKDIQERLISQANDIAGRTLFEDDAIVQQQAMLAALGRNEDQIKKVMAAAIELSTATGTDLASSVLALNKTYEGLDRGLKAIDPSMKGLTKTQLENGEAVDLISKKYQNFAESAAQIGSGPLKTFEKQWGELSEALGRLVLPSVNYLARAFTNVLNLAMSDNLTLWEKLTLKYSLDKSFSVQTEEILKNAAALKENQSAMSDYLNSSPQGFRAAFPNNGPKGGAKTVAKASGKAKDSSLPTFDGGGVDDLKTPYLDYLTSSKDFYDQMKAIDNDYTETLKAEQAERASTWTMLSMSVMNGIDGIVAGNMSLVQGVLSTTKSIVIAYEMQAMAAAIRNAVSDPTNIFFPWAAVGKATAISAAVSALFASIGGTSMGGGGGGGGGGSSYSGNSSLANGNMQTVQIVGSTILRGTDLQIVWQRQDDKNTYTRGVVGG